MRGFAGAKNPSEISLELQECIKKIKREIVVTNYNGAFEFGLKVLEKYGAAAEEIRVLMMGLIDKYSKKIFVDKGCRAGVSVSKDYPISNDWLIDVAIEAGYKRIYRMRSKKDKYWGEGEYICVASVWSVDNYKIIHMEDYVVVSVFNGVYLENMSKAILTSLVNMSIEISNK